MSAPIKPRVLVIAGSDSSGGAGIVRDIATLTAHQVKASVAVTAITAQTNQQVKARMQIDASLLHDQIKSALDTHSFQAIKIGMTGTMAAISVIAECLKQAQNRAIIFDPVLAASSGGALMHDLSLPIIQDTLLPLCDLITPNRHELALLTQNSLAENDDTAIEQGKHLLALGAKAILVKGGHGTGNQSIDFLVTPHQIRPYYAPRFDKNMRGTGCMLSSAIAAHLALGVDLEQAIERAKIYITEQFKLS